MVSSRIPGTNETISTFGSAGQGRDYTSLSIWEDATDNTNLITAARSEVLECYRDNDNHSAFVTFQMASDNWTQDLPGARFLRIVRAAATERHTGIPGTGVRFVQGDSTESMISLREKHITFEDIELDGTVNTGSHRSGFEARDNAQAKVNIIGCLIKIVNNGSGRSYGFQTNTAQQGAHILINNLIRDCTRGVDILGNSATTMRNQTVVNNSEFGIRTGTTNNSNVQIENTLHTGNSILDYEPDNASWGANRSALSGDSSSPVAGLRNQVVTFVNAAGNDFHLAPGDTGARDKGVSFASDGTWPFDDDVDRETRVDPTDIGFDEYVVPGPSFQASWATQGRVVQVTT